MGISAIGTRKNVSVIDTTEYEGVKVEEKGTVGLITYMRTDSIRLSDDFIKSTYKFIEELYFKVDKVIINMTDKEELDKE